MTWGRRVAVGALLLTLVACSDAKQSAGEVPQTRAPVEPARTAKPVRPTLAPAQVKPGTSSNTQVMPVLDHGPRDKKQIALTFDADLTALMRRRLVSGKVKSYYNKALIEELRTLHVPATLFLTGMWMEQYPEITKQLANDPLFELGTHTYDHRGFTKHCYTLGTVPRDQMLADVRRAIVELDKLDPHATRWFRFPGGCYDPTALHELAPAGVTAVGLDVPGADGFAKSAQPITKQVLDHVQNGSIVVLHMHGGDNAPYTAQAVGPIVRELRARGYQLVTVTQLVSRR
ncbi:peptidoglycan/xylan/chitin deacetylase (PgdA/CDA1 family) [Kribbella aluminosa]|uniref:Peptidoglycan/xylan/chitin deacetylase (PgdA/CDA1 family) n=1 Tax=Kribbella aluminosa TaxID=416017 RepID=A0ABS4UCD1_9ACTN|nr:polysaccharide deacetylase family protein [Kribbella aluminosa]MBP2349245.1 peptidoglycan/xylan/chitin deacetylase (PgdA/CDA1 family) [Kribbella aluminosa]